MICTSLIRDQILMLYQQAGVICELLLPLSDESPFSGIELAKQSIQEHATKMMHILLKMSTLCKISLEECIRLKIKINIKKYPVNLTKVK